MFRVTTGTIRDSWLQALRDAQTRVSQTQMQISTGQRFQRPADDPVAATRSIELTRSLESSQQFTRNAGLARNRLGLEESSLVQAGEVLQRLRELAVQANNATQTNDTRAALANEARQQLDALVQIANSQDGNGQYLFAGFSTRTQPFARSGTTVTYAGDEGVRELQVGPDRRVADSDNGADVFMRIRNGNGTFVMSAGGANTGNGVVGSSSVTNPTLYDGDTYTVTFTSATAYEVRNSANGLVTTGAYSPGQTIGFAGIQFDLSGAPAAGDTFVAAPSQNQDVFTTVQNFIDALTTTAVDPASQAQVNNGIGRTLSDLDRALDKVIDVRAGVGSRLNALDAQETVNGDLEVQLKSLLSNIKDLDYAEALSRLELQLTSLEAAQKSYSRLQGLSLFDWL